MMIKDALKRTLSLWSERFSKTCLMVKRDDNKKKKTRVMRDFLLLSNSSNYTT